MITSLFKPLPDFVTLVTLNIPDFLPVTLDFFHQRGYGVKIITVLMFFGYFYQFEFFSEIFFMLFFPVFVKFVFLMIEFTGSFFKGIPGRLAVFARNFTCFKKLISQFFKFFDFILRLAV